MQSYSNKAPINTILKGNALDRLRELETESVDCCITSPPYWALRDYKTEGQIWDSVNGCAHDFIEHDLKLAHQNRNNSEGTNEAVFSNPKRANSDNYVGTGGFCSKCNAWKGSLGLEPTFDLYIKHLIAIFSEVKRVLKRGGSCWVNMGDTYAGNRGEMRNPGFGGNREKGKQYGKDSMQAIGHRYDVKGAPEKSLCCIPERFALAMIDNGWILRNKIIWYKPNCMPSSARDRFTVDFEYFYFFVKNPRYYFETQYDQYSDETIANIRKRYSGIGLKDYEANNIQNPSKVKTRVIESIKRNLIAAGYDDMDIQTWPKIGGNKALGYENPTYSGNQPEISPYGRIKRAVWKIPTQPFSEAHFAVFPEELVITPLKSTCPEYVCKKCGKPREKIIEQGELILGQHKRPNIRQKMDDIKTHYWSAVATRHTTMINDAHYDYKETGLSDCGCNAGWSSGLCLDPFFGSGTVGVVAMQNARNFLGIELNQAYIDMAMKRLEPYLKQERITSF